MLHRRARNSAMRWRLAATWRWSVPFGRMWAPRSTLGSFISLLAAARPGRSNTLPLSLMLLLRNAVGVWLSVRGATVRLLVVRATTPTGASRNYFRPIIIG